MRGIIQTFSAKKYQPNQDSFASLSGTDAETSRPAGGEGKAVNHPIDSVIISGLKKVFSLKLVLPPGTELSLEDVRKRKLFATLIIPGIIISFVFGIYHVMHRNLLEDYKNLSTCLWLIFSLLSLRMMKKGIMDTIMDILDKFQKAINPEMMEIHNDQRHTEILKALCERDGDLAAALLKDHIEDLSNNMIRLEKKWLETLSENSD